MNFFEKKGNNYLDEITPLDCSMLLAALKADKKSDSTVRAYRVTVSKLFNRLIKMRIIRLENPMQDVPIEANRNLVRNRLPSDKEIHLLLGAADSQNAKTSNSSPMSAIIRFALLTGARRGEILHAEWGDFDLNNGLWHIQSKPDCPGVLGLGWFPKWNKERTVALFPEAVDLLLNLPKVKPFGTVVDEDGDLKEIPAEFVFPKRQIRISDSCLMKQSKRSPNCEKCTWRPDQKECEHRVIRYSRCDSLKTSWANICKKAGIKDLQFKDLRRYFNKRVLQDRLGFSLHEAGWYIGNSKEVNEKHYSPITAEMLALKLTGRDQMLLINQAKN